MFTYQARKRVFRLVEDKELAWPAETEVRFYFRPLQPFGMEAGGGRTSVTGKAATVYFNANSGVHTIESKAPLKPIEVLINEPRRIVSLDGNVLTVKERFDSLELLAETIQGIYFGFPVLLNVGLADPPIVERVDGNIGSVDFRWELADWRIESWPTTQERQESFIAKAWSCFDIISPPKRRRLIAALHYFHVACRLSRSGEAPGEFLPEVLLNLAKTLEALFPPPGDGRTRDAARSGLATLGFTSDEIEGNFIPAMALRSEIDVAHVELGLFTRDQLTTLHAYTERAEAAFRVLLDSILRHIESSEFEIAPYELQKLSKETVALINRLRDNTPSEEV